MEQIIGRHGNNWMGPSKSRKDINLYIGLMYYISGFCTSLWMIEAVFLQYQAATMLPVCSSPHMEKDQALQFCLGSWKIFVSGHSEDMGVPGVNFINIIRVTFLYKLTFTFIFAFILGLTFFY